MEVDGQTITADSLPSPEAYYAELLAKHGKDLSPCKLAPTPQPGTCPKPSSLGEIELKPQINVELILDASGSMAEPAGSEAKMDAANRRYNETSRAGGTSDASAVAAADQGWNTLSARAQENWSYATRHEEARWNSVSRASESEWDDAIRKAEGEWDRAMNDLDQQQRGTRP